MSGKKAKQQRQAVRQFVQQSADALPERGLAQGHHGYLVNAPKSHRGLYRALRKGHIQLVAPKK